MICTTDPRKRCCRAWTISTRAILSHTMTELSLLADSLDSLYFCQTPSTTSCLFPVIVCERIARVEVVHAREHLFREVGFTHGATFICYILVLCTRKGALVLGQFSTRAFLSHPMTENRQKVVECVWQKYRLSKESARRETSVIVPMWKDRASWKCPSARAPFL